MAPAKLFPFQALIANMHMYATAAFEVCLLLCLIRLQYSKARKAENAQRSCLEEKRISADFLIAVKQNLFSLYR